MTKNIKRITVTRTIIYDRDVFDRESSINDDEQFIKWVNDLVDDDFKYSSNFTQDFSIHKTNEYSFSYFTRWEVCDR